MYNGALSASRIATLATKPGESADEDHDRMDDQWEIDHFGTITAYNGSDDPNGDGINNVAEESAGTNPNPGAPAKITSVSFDFGRNDIINFTGNPNATYPVTESTTLNGFLEMISTVIVTANASGIGVATVPASHAAGPRGFSRPELP